MDYKPEIGHAVLIREFDLIGVVIGVNGNEVTVFDSLGEVMPDLESKFQAEELEYLTPDEYREAVIEGIGRLIQEPDPADSF